MDRNKYAIGWELMKSIIGIGIIYYYGDWFGAAKYLPGIDLALIICFIFSSIITTWFVLYDFRKNNTAVAKTIAIQSAL